MCSAAEFSIKFTSRTPRNDIHKYCTHEHKDKIEERMIPPFDAENMIPPLDAPTQEHSMEELRALKRQYPILFHGIKMSGKGRTAERIANEMNQRIKIHNIEAHNKTLSDNLCIVSKIIGNIWNFTDIGTIAERLEALNKDSDSHRRNIKRINDNAGRKNWLFMLILLVSMVMLLPGFADHTSSQMAFLFLSLGLTVAFQMIDKYSPEDSPEDVQAVRAISQ